MYQILHKHLTVGDDDNAINDKNGHFHFVLNLGDKIDKCICKIYKMCKPGIGIRPWFSTFVSGSLPSVSRNVLQKFCFLPFDLLL